MKAYTESLYQDIYGQFFKVDKIFFENKTEHQHLVIFENKKFGRVMALDGVIQTTEKDEFIYHEMLTHTPIFAHGNAKKVLIIGGGDGGILREVLKHENIESVTQVEIDLAVIDMCKRFLPHHSRGAYDDKRAHIIIDDGINFVKNCTEKFDVVISDSTDPIGPAEVLFTESFYELVKKNCLTEEGVLVTQNGVAFMQTHEVIDTHNRSKPHYSDSTFYSAAIPTYIGGIMTFAWLSNNTKLRQVPVETLKQRFDSSGIKTRYYNPAIHKASFALPQYILDKLHTES
jgi:spermidine synthase